MITLLSYPRSGRSLLSHVLGKAGIGVYRTHRLSIYKELPPQRGDKLIMLVRDYTECIVRHLHSEEVVSADMVSKMFGIEHGLRDRAGQYMENLVLFDMYPEKKYIIYYEDLMKHGYTEFLKLANWCGRFQLIDWDKEFNESLKNYDSKKLSGGEINYHKFKVENLDLFHKLMRDTNPFIYDKYLKRYV